MEINISFLTSHNSDELFNIVDIFSKYKDVTIKNIISNNSEDFGDLNKKFRRFKINKHYICDYEAIGKILDEDDIHYIFIYDYNDKLPDIFCEKFLWRLIRIERTINGEIIRKEYKRYNDVKNSGIVIYFATSDFHKENIIFEKHRDISDFDDAILNIEKIEEKYISVVIEKIILGTYNYIFKK